MIFAPKPLGNRRLKPDALAEDKKHCQKIGPCGIGKEAVYLNSFYIDRHYYVTFTDVRRCFKRVAMSRGGYSGRGIFGSMPYLVVQMSNGQEKQCNFKREEEVDQFLAVIEKTHPEIPTHSKAAEQRLRKAAMEEEARYLKTLTPAAQASVDELRHAKEYLEDKPEVGSLLSAAAKRKRSVDGVKKSNLVFASAILIAAVAALIFGIYEIAQGNSSWALYFVLFGVAFIFFIAAADILPTVKRNKKTVQRDWDEAVSRAQEYIDSYSPLQPVSDNAAAVRHRRATSQAASVIADTEAADSEMVEDFSDIQPSAAAANQEQPAADASVFPVSASYAHPIVLDRMIRIIREGRTDSIDEAFALMEEDLKALDHTKKVSQKEYDEVVTIKPMFRVMNYQ